MSQTSLWGLLAHGFPTAVAYDLLVHSIPTERIGAYLRFRSEVRHGSDFNHIVNTSAFPVETKYHFIREGESLCGRRSPRFTATKSEATCPGCIAIGKNLAAFGLVDPTERVPVVVRLSDLL